MPRFTSHDGTTLAHHPHGDGEPLTCPPDGTGRTSNHLGHRADGTPDPATLRTAWHTAA